MKKELKFNLKMAKKFSKVFFINRKTKFKQIKIKLNVFSYLSQNMYKKLTLSLNKIICNSKINKQIISLKLKSIKTVYLNLLKITLFFKIVDMIIYTFKKLMIYQSKLFVMNN